MLYKKYDVFKRTSQEKTESVDILDVNSSFVLMPRKDPAAMIALKCYAANCEPELSEQIRKWINRIEKAPRVRGTQGKRNEPFCKERGDLR